MSTFDFAQEVILQGNPLKFTPPNTIPSSSSLFLPFFRLKPLVLSTTNPKPFKLGWAEHSLVSSYLTPEVDVVYLGDQSEKSYYAFELGEEKSLLPEGQFKNILPLLFTLSKEESTILSQAKALMEWHSLNKHCGVCGSRTVVINHGRKRKCTNEKDENGKPTCGKVIYPRTDPVVIMLVLSPDQKRILLGRGARHPAGMYSCLAGFMEPGETIEEAVRRETKEEAGVKIGTVTYACSQPWPLLGGQLMIGCYGIAENDEINIDENEIETARWFDADEVKKGFDRSLDTKSMFDTSDFRIPSPPAIAHVLIKSWLHSVLPSL
jgi:NADH pyrophosphatase NudC (nudix superfamily)